MNADQAHDLVQNQVLSAQIPRFGTDRPAVERVRFLARQGDVLIVEPIDYDGHSLAVPLDMAQKV